VIEASPGEEGSLTTVLCGLVVLLSALLACASQGDNLRGELTKQARFDLPCPNHVELTPLQERNGTVTSYGVSGCGKRATYVLGPNLTWVMSAGPQSEAPPR
jgi:hypothetical protein